MAFVGNFTCTSFKLALLDGTMDFSADTSQTYKIALYTSSATLNADTTTYTTTNEVSGAGYTAGGVAITPTTTTSETTAYVDFSNATWTNSTITARGALIYSAGGTNPAVAVLDFGSDKSSNSSTFTVTFPTAAASTAIIRIG
jgi:hypothetical protein